VRPGEAIANGINRPEVVAAITAVFADYEAALCRHDVDALNGYFWNSPATLRYGIGEHSLGIAAIVTYRAMAAAVHPGRQLQNTVITTFGMDTASVATEFTAPDTSLIGRQTQVWIRFADGWKIIAAHVSAIEPEKLVRY
jgi:ketosteroid isomerase-like protein